MLKTLKTKIRKWLEIPEAKPAEPEPVKDAAYFLVNRHYLLSVGPEDTDEYLETSNESERKAYEAEASTVFNNRVFKQEIKHLLAAQALFLANEAHDWEQTLIGRGNVNGIGLVLDRFEELNSRHLENVRRPEPAIDRHGLMPE